MTTTGQRETSDADALYERYGKSLEDEHWGRYVAIAPDGRVILAATVVEALQQATASFGPGSHIFKVGERAIGKWRSPRFPRSDFV